MLGWKEAFWLCCPGYLFGYLREIAMSDREGWQPVGWSLGAWRVCDWGGLNVIEGWLQKEFWRTFSLCVFLSWITRTEEAELKLRLSPAHLPSSWSLFFLCCLWWFLCNLLSLWEQLGNFSAPKGSCWFRHWFLQFREMVWWNLAVLGLWLTWWS